MDRRDLMKYGLGAAAVAVAPKVLDACVNTNSRIKPPGATITTSPPFTRLPRLAGASKTIMYKPKPLRGSIICGPTCSSLGMVGSYPNCYYPQYLSLNRSLNSQLQQATLAAYHAISNRTVTQAQLDNLNSLRSAYTAHLSVGQTAINDGVREQWIGASIYDGPSQANYVFAQEISNNNGLDANVANNLVYCGMPQCDNQYVTELHDQIMNLPNYQGLDQLSLWSDAVVASVSAPQPGWLESSFGSPQDLIATGEQTMAMSTVVGAYCGNTGPAAEDCFAFAGALALGGFMLYALGYAMSTQ